MFNIGSDQPVSILELAQRVVRIADPSRRSSSRATRKPTTAISRTSAGACPNLARLRSTIDHQPAYDLDGIIRSWSGEAGDRSELAR